jgi:hypothetical protein
VNTRIGRRLTLAVVTGILVMAPSATLAGGGGGPVSITTTIEGSFVRQFTNGFAVATCGEVGKELVPDPLPVPWDWSTAFEFSLPIIPLDATILNATLTLTDADGDSPDPMRIYGYPGDGIMSSLDHDQAPGTPVAFTPTGTTPEDHDVTSLVGVAQLTSGWAGFLILPDTSDFSTTVHHSFDCSDGEDPVLTITWGPGPTTPLPDASMDQPGTSPLTAVGAILLALAALLGVGRVPARQAERSHRD